MTTNRSIRVYQVHDKSRDTIVLVFQCLQEFLDMLWIILVEFLDAFVTSLEEGIVKLYQNRSLLAKFAPYLTLSSVFFVFGSR
jgi:hypothetical protein